MRFVAADHALRVYKVKCRDRFGLKISRLTAIWAPSGRFEPIWSDQLLAAAVIEPLGAVRASADATSGFSDVKLA